MNKAGEEESRRRAQEERQKREAREKKEKEASKKAEEVPKNSLTNLHISLLTT